MPVVQVYTDGSAYPQLSRYSNSFCAWAWVIPKKDGIHYLKDSGIATGKNTTGEILAVVNALRFISQRIGTGLEVQVFCDYCAVSSALNGNLDKWKANNWRKKHPSRTTHAHGRLMLSDEAEWRLLDAEVGKFQDVVGINLASHSGDKWNDRVDKVAGSTLRHEANRRIRDGIISESMIFSKSY